MLVDTAVLEELANAAAAVHCHDHRNRPKRPRSGQPWRLRDHRLMGDDDIHRRIHTAVSVSGRGATMRISSLAARVHAAQRLLRRPHARRSSVVSLAALDTSASRPQRLLSP